MFELTEEQLLALDAREQLPVAVDPRTGQALAEKRDILHFAAYIAIAHNAAVRRRWS